jgi:hypothetical protein
MRASIFRAEVRGTREGLGRFRESPDPGLSLR